MNHCKRQRTLAIPKAAQTGALDCTIRAQAVSACFALPADSKTTAETEESIRKRNFCSDYIIFKLCQEFQNYNSEGQQDLALNTAFQQQGRERAAETC